MATLRIPKRYHEGIAKFLSLPEEHYQRLISNLQNTPFSFNIKEGLIKAISSIEEISSGDATKIADALMTLYIDRVTADKSTADFINDLSQGIAESRSEEFAPIDEIRSRVVPRLTQLYESESVMLAARASGVLFEYDHIFYKARILTDIRPVFGESAKDAKAVMIIHNLRIHYHQGEDHKDFYVALDAKDVQKLIDTLERSKTKAETLKSVLGAANIPYIEPE